MSFRSLAAFATSVVVASAASALASPPDPAKHTVPAFMRLGGAQTQGGAPDPSIAFTITIRDFLNNPIVGAVVAVDFANCPDTRLCLAVVGGHQLQCANHSVLGITDVSGQVHMSLLGATDNGGTTVPPAIAPGAASGCIRVYADGVQIATATCIVYDQNGALPGGNGVNGLDISIAKTDVGASGLGAPYRGRSDYTADNAVNGADLSALRTIVGQSGLGLGSGAGCAGAGTTQPYCP